MESALIEHAWIDLNAAPLRASRVIDFTVPTDAKWAGVVELAPGETFSLEDGDRYDFYLLRGSVNVEGRALEIGDFLIHQDSAVMQAADDGARLLAYREAGDESPHQFARLAKGRIWRNGINPQMQVAPLDGGQHRISLVAWEPGAQTQRHTHPAGEEMFVLSGELSDADERYPTGTWLRLHPGSTHAPFARVPTVILLRHGHLAPVQ